MTHVVPGPVVFAYAFPHKKSQDFILRLVATGGVTAHLIDARVDAGRIVERRVIERHADDSLVDLSLRLYETQLDMLPEALRRIREPQGHEFPPVPPGRYNRRFPDELLPELQARLG